MSRKRLILLLILTWLVLYGKKNMDMILFYGGKEMPKKDIVESFPFKSICIKNVATSSITYIGKEDPCEDSQ